MNFFQFHVGDWSAATGHLSLLEDAVYGRLVRRYYTTELPLPADHAEVCRVVGARAMAERKAVDTVLAEFFELRDDGYHQARCDREIADYLKVQSAADEVRNAEQERMRRYRQERSDLYAVLRDHGVTLSWNAPMQRVRELARQYGARALSDLPAPQPATHLQRGCNAPATAIPIPNTQHPIPNPQQDTHTTGGATATRGGVGPEEGPNTVTSLEIWAGSSAGQGGEAVPVTRPATGPATPAMAEPATPPATVADGGVAASLLPTPTAAGRVCRLMRQAGIADTNPGHPQLLQMIQSGVGDEQFVWAAAAALEKRKGFVYALGVLRGAIGEAKALPAHVSQVGPAPTLAEINNFRAAPSLFKGAAGDRIRKYLEEQKHAATEIAA